MQTTSRVLETDIDTVWSVLGDGWLFPLFVVGASRMREVDDAWPAPGSRLHHSVGSWPALLDDDTEVLDADPPSRLRLRARAWPSGEAEVEFTLEAQGSSTLVQLSEDAVAGPGTSSRPWSGTRCCSGATPRRSAVSRTSPSTAGPDEGSQRR